MNPPDPLDILRDLIALPSVNPMGRDVAEDAAGKQFFEYRVTDYLERFFRGLEIPFVRQPIAPLRENIIARLDGDFRSPADERVLLFEAHQDTVPVDGMTIEPWNPVVRDGRVYGRGSCDVKGGMAAMLAALARIAVERPAGRPTLVMACTVNEEHGHSGANDLPALWTGATPFLRRRPDAAIVAEPTSLDVVVAHKGTVRWRCRTGGTAAHSSQPGRGDNAIFRMARVLLALEEYQRDIAGRMGEHRLCGPVTLSVGVIHGGVSVNTVPDQCAIEIDRRLIPGDDPAAARGHVVDFVRQRMGNDPLVAHDEPFLVGRSLSDALNGGLAERLATTAGDAIGPRRIIGVPFGTDAPCLAEVGVPTVVFGPGSIDQAHTADEWLEIHQLRQAAEVLGRLARGV